jgi:hypothetical protein
MYRRFLICCSQARKSVHLTVDHCLLQHLNSVAAHPVTMWRFTHALLPQKAGVVQDHAGLRRHDSLQAVSSASEFEGNRQPQATLCQNPEYRNLLTFQMILGSRSRPAGQDHSNWWSHGDLPVKTTETGGHTETCRSRPQQLVVLSVSS